MSEITHSVQCELLAESGEIVNSDVQILNGKGLLWRYGQRFDRV